MTRHHDDKNQGFAITEGKQMRDFLDLDTYPIDQPGSEPYLALVKRCQDDLVDKGMFNLDGLLLSNACLKAVDEINPVMQNSSFTHRREHNIYFLKNIPELDPEHPALRKVETINHTVCADQILDSIVVKVYEYEPLIRFIADTMQKPRLFTMPDPLARVNVMAYRDGEALNWHFDRSEFTTTLLLQNPEAGGLFEYRSDLRSDSNPNYEGVARLLNSEDSKRHSIQSCAGTLTVFRGKNTAHRVTPIEGHKARIVTVYSYYEQPDRYFSDEELLGFFGRTR
jgi:hypothetical protein